MNTACMYLSEALSNHLPSSYPQAAPASFLSLAKPQRTQRSVAASERKYKRMQSDCRVRPSWPSVII